MHDEQWLDEFVGWLETYPWRWFATLTSRPELSEVQLRYRLRRWGSELGGALGTREYQWIGVPEYGSTGLHYHYHVLIAGLKPGCGAAERLHWARVWYKLAGDARIDDFAPNSGGVRYVLKSARPGDVDAIEFHLTTRPAFETKSDVRSLDNSK